MPLQRNKVQSNTQTAPAKIGGPTPAKKNQIQKNAQAIAQNPTPKRDISQDYKSLQKNIQSNQGILTSINDYLKNSKYDKNTNAAYLKQIERISSKIGGHIGVKDYDSARDDYDNYLGQLKTALQSRQTNYDEIGADNYNKLWDASQIKDISQYEQYVSDLQKHADEAKKGKSKAWWQNVGNILANAGNALSGNTFMPADTNIAAGAKAEAQKAEEEYQYAQDVLNIAKEAELNRKYAALSSYKAVERAQAKYSPDSYEYQWLGNLAKSKKTAGDYRNEAEEVQKQIDELKRTNYYGVVGQEFNSQTGETYDRTGWVNDDKIKQLENQKQDLEGWENALVKKQEYTNKTKLSDFKSLSEVPGDAYLGAFSGDMLYSYINGENFGSEEARSIGKFTSKQLNKLTDEEKQIYNYIHNTEGKEAANEYLQYLKYDLNARVADETQEENVRFANEHPVLASAASVPTSLASGVGILDAAYQNIRRDITGEPTRIDYNTGAQQVVKTTTNIRGTVAKNITDATGVIDIDPAEHPVFAQILNGKSLGDVYQLGMSTVDSMAAAAIGNITGVGATASVLLGGSAGSQGVLEALDKGATDEQALMMGLFNGAFETLFEYVSMDKLLHSSGNVVADMLTQMFTEGSEEVNTSIANAIAERVILNENSDFRKEIRRLMDEGMSEEEAAQQAWKDLGTGLLWDFIGGAAMGGVSSVAWNSLGNTSKALTDNRAYKGNASEIVNTGDALRAMQESAGLNDSAETADNVLEYLSGKKTADTADTLFNAVDALRSKIEAGEKVTNKDVRTVQEHIDKASRQVVENAIKESLSGTGNEQRASQIADAIFEGKGISAKKGTAWIGQNEGLNKAYRAGMNSYADMLELADQAAKLTQQNEEAAKNGNKENAFNAEQRANALRSGADVLRSTKNLDRNAPIASNGDRLSNVTGIKVDGDTVNATLSTGETVKLDDLDIIERPGTSDEASFGYQIKRLVKSYGEASQAVYQGFLNSGMTLSAYLDVADRITTIAKSSSLGYAEGIKALRNSKLVQGLSNLQQEHLWSIGKGLVVKQKAATKKSSYRDVDVSTEDIEIGGETFKGASDMEAGYKDLATKISKASKGNLSFHFYHGGEGNNTNGFYQSGVVYINVDAVRDGKSLVSYTMSHELTHFIQEYNADAYKKLKDFVVKKLTKKKGKTLNALVLEKQARDKGISYEDALDEVVADGCEMMLQNSNILEELAVQDQSLAQTVISHAKAFLKRVTSGLNPIHDEAKELMKYADQLQKMWDKALAEALTSEQEQKYVRSDDVEIKYKKADFEYMKPFAEQLKDFMDREHRSEIFGNDALMIGSTPKVLMDIGLTKLPVVIDQKHVGYAIDDQYKGPEKYKAGHTFDITEFAKLPEKLADPIAIIADTSRENLVAYIEMQNKAGVQTIVPIRINTGASIGGNNIDVQVAKTAFGDNDAENQIINAIIKDSKDSIRLYYANKKKIPSEIGEAVRKHGLTVPNGIIHSINEPGSVVKQNINSQTETRQFKQWFNGSKVVNKDGSPLIVYHGSPATDIEAFDLDMAGKNTGVYSDKAIWFTDDYSFADGMAYEQLPGSSMFTVKRGKKGKVYGTYLSIKKPFNFRSMTSRMRNDLYEMYQKRLKDQGFSPKSRAEFDEEIDIALEAGNDQFAKFYLDYDMLRQKGYDGIIARLYSYPQNRGDALEYGVLKNTQIKSATDNVGTYDGENTNIYYSKQDIGEADTVVYDEDGEVAAYTDEDGNIQFSRASWDEIGRDKLYDFLDKQIEAGELNKSEAKKIKKEMETLYGILKEFEDSDEFATYSQWSKATIKTDDNGMPILSVITPNGEYKMNIDYSLVCKKRRTLDAVYNKLVELGAADDVFANTKDASSKQIVTINNLIRREGFETACALCFVDAKRFRVINVADQFVNIWNRTVNSLSKDPIAYHNFGGDKTLPDIKNGIDTYDDSQLDFSYIEKVLAKEANRESHTVPYKVAQYIKENPSERKLLSRGDFISSNGFGTVQLASPGILKLYNQKKGSGGPKASFFDKVYANDIIDSSAFKAKAAYEVGGVRLQSFSDYVAHLVFDYLQAFSELSAKKLPAHAYTKEALFALQFGKTGMKINMSLVPNVKANGVAVGLDADGNYAWAGESFANEWVRDNEKFLTELGYGDIFYDENGKRRKMSNLGFELAKKIQRAEGYTDNVGTIAVGVSDEHIRKMLRDPDIRMVIPYHKSGLNPVVAKMNNISAFTDYTNIQNTREYKDGKWSKVKTEPFSWNKWLHENPSKTAKDAANEYLRICDERGLKPRFDQFRNEENYYKLLEDFTEYNEQGEYVAQGAVQMNFPTADDAFGDMKSLVKHGLSEDESLNKRQNEKVEKIAKEIMSVSETKEWIKGEYDFGEKPRYSKADMLDKAGVTDSETRSWLSYEMVRAKYEGNRAVFSEERFNKELERFAYDGKPNRSQAYMAFVKPYEFLYATSTNVQKIREESGDLDEEKLRESGQIYLRVNFETGEILGHEGRHRMSALEKAGYDEVAIVITNSDGRDHVWTDNAQPIRSKKLEGQDFGEKYKKTLGFYAHELIPLNQNFAEIGKAIFENKGAGNIQFSRADITDDELTEALADEDYERAERVANNDAALSRKALKHDLLNRFSIPEGLRDNLGKKIDSFADDILRDGVVNENTKEDLYNDLYDAGIIKMPAEETATLAAEQMKGSRLYVPEAVKAEFAGDYNRIRTKLMGYKVYLTSDAKDIGVDTLNAEMAEQFPHLFDATSSDEKEILENILDIFENQAKDKEYTLDDYAEMMRKTEGLDIESQQESLERGFDYAVQAFSEKAELEFTLRNRLAGKLTREGEAKLQQRIQDLKAQRKDLKQAEEDLEKKVRAVQRERDRAQEQVLFYRNQLSVNKNFKKAKPEDVNRFTRNLLESDLWWPVRTQARDIYADMNAIASNLMNGKTDIYDAAYNIAAKCINSAIDVYGKDGRQDDYISALTSEIISGLFDADVRQEYTYAERMQNRLERAKADNKELKAKYQALKKQQAERRKASKYKQQILKLYDTANKMLTSPKKSITGHAAMDLMRAVAEMCQYIGTAQDKFYTNKYEALDKLIDEQGSTETRVNRERHLKKTIQQLSELQFRYNQVKNDPMYNYEYDESVNEMLNTLKDTLSGNTLDDLESDKLREIYDAMSALMKTVTEANKLTALNTEKTVLEFAKEAGADIDKAQAIKNETLRDYMNKQKSPDVMFNYFGGYKKGSSFNKMQQMFVDSMRRYLEVKKQFQEIFDESITNNKEFKQMMYEPTKHLVDWGLKDQDGNAVATSRGMMLAAYKLLLQEDSFNAIAKAGFQIPKIEAFYKDDMARAFGGGDDAKFYSQNRAQDLYAIVDRLQELDTQEEDLKADKANISSEEYNKQLNSIESQKRQQLRRWGNIFEEECAKLEELKSNIEDQLTDFEKEFLAKADQWYTHSDDLRNEVNLALYGFVKPGVKNYTPIHRDLAEVQMDIRTDNTDAPANLENAGFNKERVKARAPIQLTDINFDLLHSSEGIARFYGFTEAQRTFNKIYNAKVLGSGKDRNGQDITVKSKIGNKFGTGNRKWLVTGNQYIENYIRSIAGSNFSRENKFGKVYGHVARANLTLNLRVAVSQLASIPTAAAVLGWDNVLRGMGQGIGYAFSTKQKDQLAEKSIYFWQRYKGDGGMPEYSDASRGAGVIDRLYNRLQNTKVGHALLDWCKIMDCAATSMMYPMAEAYVNQHFGDLEGEARETKIIEIYEETLRKTQPNYTETERSDLLRDKTMAMKIFTMFKTQSNQNLNLLINANGELRRVIRDKANGNATQAEVQEAKRNFANSFTAVVLGGSLAFAVLRMMSNFILGTLSGYRDDDDELTEESVLKGLGKEVLSSLAGNFMGGSMVFDFVWARVNHESYYGISDNAMGAISDLVDSAFKLQVTPDEGSEKPWAKVISSWTKFALEVCDFAGIPVSNAKKITEAGEMWANDLKNGTFGKFEGNVERTDAQNYNIIIKRFLNEDYAGSQEMYDSMFTSWGEKQDVEAGMKRSIKDKFIEGHITEDDAMSLLLSYVMDDENDAADLITEWHGVIDTGYTYNDIQEAYMEGSATANDLRNYMSTYKFMEKDAIDKKINELDFETENGFAPSKLKDAYVEGEITAQEAARYYHEVYGKDLDDAKVRVSEWQAYKDTGIEYSEIEDAYYDGKITYNQVVNMLKKYGDKSNSEYSNDEQAVRYADKWRFNKENPKYAGELDVNQVSRWYSEYKGKVKIDKFMMYLDFIGNGYHGAAPSQTEILEWMPSHLTYEEALALWTYKGWSTSNKNMKKLTNAYGK